MPLRPHGPTLGKATILVTIALAGCGSDSTGPGVQENPCAAAVPIQLGQTRDGFLLAGDCSDAGGILRDRWELNLSEEVALQVDLSSQSFDAYLELRNASGTLVAENDDWTGLDARILQTVPAGRYILVARTLSPGESGAYRLTVKVGPDCSDEGGIPPGSSVQGELAAGDCFLPFLGLVDWWSLPVGEAGKYRIDLEAPFDEILLLADAAGEILAYSDWGSLVGHARLELQLNPGTWRLGVSAPSVDVVGSYDLAAALAPACGPGGDVSPGDSFSGAVSAEDCTLEGYAPADSVGLVLTGPTNVVLRGSSAQSGLTLLILDQSGLPLAWGEDADVRVTLPAGQYAVFVLILQPPFVGSYSVDVLEEDCADAGALSLGQTVTGALDPSDCLRAGGGYRESWTFALDAETRVRFEQSSAVVDTYVQVEDSAGNVLGWDDDGAGGTNSRLDITLSAGSYRVVASSFSVGETGDYSLSAAVAPSSSVVSGGTLSGAMKAPASPPGLGAGPWGAAWKRPEGRLPR